MTYNMLLLNKINNVFKITKIKNEIIAGVDNTANGDRIFSGGDELISLNKSEFNSFYKGSIYTYIPFLEGVAYTEKNGSSIRYKDNNSNSILIDDKEGKVYFDSLQERSIECGFIFRKKNEGGKKNFIFFPDCTKSEIPFSFKLIHNNYYLDWILSGIIKVFIWYEGKIQFSWEENICKYGEIDERNTLFCSNEIVYIPLQGGLLLALNVKWGNFIWLQDKNLEIYCSYDCSTDNIYQSYGRGLLSINSLNGEIIRSLNFSQIFQLQSFQASGPIWCFEKVIVLIDSIYGKVVVLNYGFELVGFYEIGKPGIANSREKIVYSDGCLYVLGMDNILYIFEIII